MDVIELWEDSVERGEVFLEQQAGDPAREVASYYANRDGVVFATVRVTEEKRHAGTVRKALMVRA